MVVSCGGGDGRMGPAPAEMVERKKGPHEFQKRFPSPKVAESGEGRIRTYRPAGGRL
jgi:hypothetical protein